MIKKQAPAIPPKQETLWTEHLYREEKTERKRLDKAFVKACLMEGKSLDKIFPLQAGQECEIFKAEEWSADDTVIYIPDLWVHSLTFYNPLKEDEIDDVMDLLYTGEDFVAICGGNKEIAERVFHFVDWQTPGSAYAEGGWEEEFHVEKKMTAKEMEQIFTMEIPLEGLVLDSGIFEFHEIGCKSIGVSYETYDDGNLVYIFNLFIRGQYINISGEYENIYDAAKEVTDAWNSWNSFPME